MAATTCATVTVTVTDEDGNVTTKVVPAYTRPLPELRTLLKGHVATYLERSRLEGEPGSLGDFALYLLVKAADDPRVIA